MIPAHKKAPCSLLQGAFLYLSLYELTLLFPLVPWFPLPLPS